FAEAIVRGVEAVEIEQREREALLVACAARELYADALLERAAIQQPRERVVGVVVARAWEAARAMQRDRDDLREQAQGLEILGCELARRARRAEHADDML